MLSRQPQKMLSRQPQKTLIRQPQFTQPQKTPIRQPQFTQPRKTPIRQPQFTQPRKTLARQHNLLNFQTRNMSTFGKIIIPHSVDIIGRTLTLNKGLENSKKFNF